MANSSYLKPIEASIILQDVSLDYVARYREQLEFIGVSRETIDVTIKPQGRVFISTTQHGISDALLAEQALVVA